MASTSASSKLTTPVSGTASGTGSGTGSGKPTTPAPTTPAPTTPVPTTPAPSKSARKPDDEPIPTHVIAVPVTEGGSYIFAARGAEIVSAILRVGKSVLSYAEPGSDMGEGRLMLDFFGNGTRFHSGLVPAGSPIEVEIEYRGEAYPHLHMADGGHLNKKWAPNMSTWVDNVQVTNKLGAKFTAELVYMRNACGLRAMKPVIAASAVPAIEPAPDTEPACD